MFSRLNFIEHTDTIGLVAFILCALVFIAYLIYAARMTKSQADYMASRPLEDENSENKELK